MIDRIEHLELSFGQWRHQEFCTSYSAKDELNVIVPYLSGIAYLLLESLQCITRTVDYQSS